MPELNITIPSHLLLNSTDACCISINIDPPPEKGDLTNCCPVTAALCTHDCDTCIGINVMRPIIYWTNKPRILVEINFTFNF